MEYEAEVVREKAMNARSFEQAKQYAANRLEHELAPSLFYHRAAHTRDDVVPAVERLARLEGVHGQPLLLLCTAAWFHDLGFIEQLPYHEMISARIAAEVLPGFGYSPHQVEIVREAIFATIVPQAPQTLLERILADADLNVLGREDFLERNASLRRELAMFGKVYSDLEWYKNQVSFVESHHYFTQSAIDLYTRQKLANIAALKQIVADLSTGG
jgi:uncharacterized protein